MGTAQEYQRVALSSFRLVNRPPCGRRRTVLSLVSDCGWYTVSNVDLRRRDIALPIALEVPQFPPETAPGRVFEALRLNIPLT